MKCAYIYMYLSIYFTRELIVLIAFNYILTPVSIIFLLKLMSPAQQILVLGTEVELLIRRN